MISSWRSSESRTPRSSSMRASSSASRFSSCVRSRAVSLASRMFRMASACTSLSPKRSWSASDASSRSAEARMILMTSSM